MLPAGTGNAVEPIEKRSTCNRIARTVARVAVAGAFAGALLFSGARPAEAARSENIFAQVQSQESGFDWNALLPFATALSVAIAAVALVRNTKEKVADRFFEALQSIKGESTGEERLVRLNVIAHFANRLGYASSVLEASAMYLRARRGSLIKLQKEHEGKPKDLEDAITERRNADRSAFKLFLETLPAVRRQIDRQESIKLIARHVLKPLRISYKEGDELKLQRLDKLTGFRVDVEKPRVNARGICMDDMRGEVYGCNLEYVDLTGAGLQRNDIKRVIFDGALLCQVQLEGSQLAGCSLKGTDLRAASLGETVYAIFDRCVIDADTKFGNLPDDHPDSKRGMLEPDRADEYRGIPNVVLRDLRSDTLSPDEIIQVIHNWQRNGLILKQGSNPEYFLTQP